MSARQARTYTADQVIGALQAKGIPYKREGREIEADPHGTGHYPIKIAPHKGVYLDAATGVGGTISTLFRRLGTSAPVAAVAPVAREERADTTFAAQRVWSMAWTCTHAEDTPAGWDKGLNVGHKGVARIRLERQRDTVRTYVSARLGPVYVDHWMRQVRIGADGLMLTPMQSDGQLVGIQRTYLDAAGKKTERKMLGRHGVCRLSPPPGVVPHKLGEAVNALVLLGEGWESVAAAVQGTGWSGIVGYDAGGMVSWAKQQAAAAQGQPPEQLAATPTVGVLVDRDLGETGPKASARVVRILRQAGLKAVFLIPPAAEHGGPRGGPKGSDWGDYPQEGISAEVMITHLKLALLQGNDLMPPVIEGATSENERYADLMPVRKASAPRRIAQTMSVEVARARVKRECSRFFIAAKRWHAWQKRSPADRKNQQKPQPPMPSLGLEITTGTGKSSEFRALIQQFKDAGIPMVLVAKNKKAAEAYEAAGAFWRHGHEDVGDFSIPWHCPKMSLVGEVSENEHAVGPTICASAHCEHGNKRALRVARSPSPQVIRFFREFPELEETASESCWLDHLEDAQEQVVIVCTGQGFGPADLTAAAGARVVILDEGVEWTHSHLLELANLRGYLININRLLSQAAMDTQGNTRAAAEDAAELIDLLQEMQPILQQLAAALGKYCDTNGAAVDAPAEIVSLARAMENLADTHTQAWERPTWTRWTELVSAPLRAAHEIVTAAKNGALTIINGTLLAVYLHPAIAAAVGHHPVLVADATMHPSARAAILAADGEIVRVVAEQGLSWVCDPSRFRAAPQRDSRGHIDEAAIAEEVQGILDARIALRGAREIALIAQRPKAIRALAALTRTTTEALEALPRPELWELTISHGIGWWGWHDTAHDEFAERDLIMWDQPAIPRSILRQKWEEYRTMRIALGESPTDIPHWTDSWVPDEWVCVGDQDQQSRAALHTNPKIRAFIQALWDAHRLQWAGRARGVNHPGCTIYQMGGSPLAALADHGVAVRYARLDAKLTNAERKSRQHEESLRQYYAAANRLIGNGQEITRETLDQAARAIGADTGEIIRPAADKGFQCRGTNVTAPRHATFTEWSEMVMPLVPEHFSTSGQKGGEVKAARESVAKAAAKFGEEHIEAALDTAISLLKSATSVDACAGAAWEIIESDLGDVNVTAAWLVLEAIRRTDGLPPPWG